MPTLNLVIKKHSCAFLKPYVKTTVVNPDIANPSHRWYVEQG